MLLYVSVTFWAQGIDILFLIKGVQLLESEAELWFRQTKQNFEAT